MNERIRELAKQAGLVQGSWANADLVRIWKEDPDNPGSLEKFAELIVKECAILTTKYQVGTTHLPDIIVSYNYSHNLAEIIKEHFGVKE